MHPSTVSRAVANKYVHTSQGVFELRFFFSEGVNGPEGGDRPLVRRAGAGARAATGGGGAEPPKATRITRGSKRRHQAHDDRGVHYSPPVSIFASAEALDPSRAVKSLTLPAQPHLKLFALTLEQAG